MDIMMSQKEAKRAQVRELLTASKVAQKEDGKRLAPKRQRAVYNRPLLFSTPPDGSHINAIVNRVRSTRPLKVKTGVQTRVTVHGLYGIFTGTLLSVTVPSPS